MTDRFTKQPSEVLDYLCECDELFDDNPADDISGVVLTVTETGAPPDLVVDSYQLLGSPAQDFKVWLSGGVSGITYKITAVITTTDGRVYEHDFKVKVKDT